MLFAALTEAADCGELLLVDGGLLRFHLRRDGSITIREIVVLPSVRRLGVGRRLVSRVRELHPNRTINCKCPVSLKGSNQFWKSLGFEKVGTSGLAGKELNHWRL